MVCLLSRETNDHALATAARTDLMVATGLILPWFGYRATILTRCRLEQLQHEQPKDRPKAVHSLQCNKQICPLRGCHSCVKRYKC